MAGGEIKRQIEAKLYLMSFLWRCGEAVLNFNHGKLPWEGSALALIPGWIFTPSICVTLAGSSEQTTTSWEKAVRETSKLELYKLQKVKLQTGGRLLRKGQLAAQGLAGKHIKAASCEIFRLKKTHRRWELSSSSSKELLMLSSGACSHVILLWLLGNKSLPCPSSISCLQSIFWCPNTVTPKGYTSQPFLYFFFQISPSLWHSPPVYPWI